MVYSLYYDMSFKLPNNGLVIMRDLRARDVIAELNRLFSQYYPTYGVVIRKDRFYNIIKGTSRGGPTSEKIRGIVSIVRQADSLFSQIARDNYTQGEDINMITSLV